MNSETTIKRLAWAQRSVTHHELEQARNPGVIIRTLVNGLRALLEPCEDVHTRVFVDGILQITFIEVWID